MEVTGSLAMIWLSAVPEFEKASSKLYICDGYTIQFPLLSDPDPVVGLW